MADGLATTLAICQFSAVSSSLKHFCPGHTSSMFAFIGWQQGVGVAASDILICRWRQTCVCGARAGTRSVSLNLQLPFEPKPSGSAYHTDSFKDAFPILCSQ